MVWTEYQAACELVGIRVAAYKTFCGLWKDELAHITVMKPMTDLCHVCQLNSTAILKAANTSEENKTEVRNCTINNPYSTCVQ